MMTPEEFRDRWGDDIWMKLLPASLENIAISNEAKAFLIEVGLPHSVIIEDSDAPSELNFERLRQGIEPVSRQGVIDSLLLPNLSRFWVIGDEIFSHGSAWYCVEDGTGTLIRLDVALTEPISTVNSSIPRFAESLLILCEWSRSRLIGSDGEEWLSQLSQLEASLKRVDPEATGDPNNWWLAMLSYARSQNFRNLNIHSNKDL